MLLISPYIEIGKWRFDHCVEIGIVSDIDSLTTTCRVSILGQDNWPDKDIAAGDEPYIKRKDKVVVQMGYDGKLKTQFVGYVKNVRAGLPLTVECEDSMFLLKQKPIEKLTLQAGKTLKQWLDIIIPKQLRSSINPDGLQVVTSDIVMGELRITQKSPAEVLEWLKSNYGFHSYFRINEEGAPVLYVGLAYTRLAGDRQECTYRYGSDIIEDPDTGLIYKRAEDIRLKVKAISMNPANTRIEAEAGDEDGELRTIYYYNVDQKTLKQRAEEELKRLKYTGYRGSFTTFGEPSIRIGDIANLVGNQYYPDGRYLVSKVTKKIDAVKGYTQTIEPRQIVND